MTVGEIREVSQPSARPGGIIRASAVFTIEKVFPRHSIRVQGGGRQPYIIVRCDSEKKNTDSD